MLSAAMMQIDAAVKMNIIITVLTAVYTAGPYKFLMTIKNGKKSIKSKEIMKCAIAKRKVTI